MTGSADHTGQTGAGTLVIGAGTNGGTVELDGANTYSGGTVLEGGTVIAGNAKAFGGGTIHAIDPTITYKASGTYANSIELDVGSPASHDPTTFVVDSGVTATITGALATGTGKNALNQTIDTSQPVVVSGPGSLVLASGASTYTGRTTIKAGATLELATTDTVSNCAVLRKPLGPGWHGLEERPGHVRRWTEGAAALPPRARLVIVDLVGDGRYWIERRDNVVALRA